MGEGEGEGTGEGTGTGEGEGHRTEMWAARGAGGLIVSKRRGQGG
jgi:hypothetical protein